MTGSDNYDVVVVGGGNAGVAAAIGAARAGARTALVEKYGCLGGAATMRSVFTYCGIYTLGENVRQAVFGVGEDLLGKLRAIGAVSSPIRHRGIFVVFDPEALKYALDDLCIEAGVDLYLHSMVIRAERDGDRLTTITYADHGGEHQLSARAFVDSSGDCDLAWLARASTRYGNHGDVNLGTLGTRFGGIPSSVEVTAAKFEAAIKTAQKNGLSPITKTTSVMVRLPYSHDLCCYLASADYDPRDVRSLSDAEVSGRRQARAYLAALRTIPGCEDAYLAQSGPGFGTRESRHINAVRPLVWRDAMAGNPTGECIALGAWGVEWHDRASFASSFTLPVSGAYEIPLGALISADTLNLFAAGRTADGDREAGASLRVMGTALATGHASGVAAAMLADAGTCAHAAVATELRRQNAMIDLGALDNQPIIKGF